MNSFRLSLVVAIGAALIIALGVFASRSLGTLNESTEFAASTQTGRFQVAHLLQTLTDMGGGVRRFEATQDIDSFQEAEAAATALPSELAELQTSFADDPAQRPMMKELIDLSQQRDSQTRRLIERAAAGDMNEVKTQIAAAEGSRIMDATRALVARMQLEQTRRLQQQRARATEARQTVAFAIAAATGLATLLLLLVAYLSQRHTERLQRSQEELATTMRSIGDGVISTNAIGGVVFMNTVAEQLTGWTTAEARSLNLDQIFKIINEDTRDPIENPVALVLRDKRTVGMANDTVLIDRAGNERPIEDSAAPIFGLKGEIAGVVLAFRDATAVRAAQRALTKSESTLREANANLEARITERTRQLMAQEALIRTFYEHSSECHAVLIEAGAGQFRYEEINPATLRLYGMTRAQVIGHTIDEIFDAVTARELDAHLSECLRLNAPYRYERTHANEIIEAVATPVPHETGIGRRIVVSARDVSERRRLEQQLLQSQKMEAVGQLTGGLAHDFNNLLTGIMGSFELLQTRVAQGRVSDLDRYVSAGQAAAKRAAALTHRLLAFSRRQTLDPKPTDVNRLVTDMADLIRRTVGPEITLDFVGGVGLWSPSIDANQLENALLNLCINARDAMPAGGKITIETANRWIDERMARDRELSPGQYISLCVSDTGCGMSPEVVSRAFDPFFTTKPLGQGTGLGLSMIYGFARQSGGQVRIYSEIGKGAMICLYLPRYLGEKQPVEFSASLPRAPAAGHGETVLVVDDEPVVRMLVVEVLEGMGYRAIESPDGVAALKVFESKARIDLLVTDVGLPNGINGRQLADAGRALRPGLSVLFITGYAENAVFSHGHIESGFDVLSKPFAIEELATRISSLMKRPNKAQDSASS
jgi:PAS domain S-box-containing protein